MLFFCEHIENIQLLITELKRVKIAAEQVIRFGKSSSLNYPSDAEGW